MIDRPSLPPSLHLPISLPIHPFLFRSFHLLLLFLPSSQVASGKYSVSNGIVVHGVPLSLSPPTLSTPHHHHHSGITTLTIITIQSSPSPPSFSLTIPPSQLHPTTFSSADFASTPASQTHSWSYRKLPSGSGICNLDAVHSMVGGGCHYCVCVCGGVGGVRGCVC